MLYQFQEWNGGPGNIKTASLNLVDLAGSESQKDTGASGLRLKVRYSTKVLSWQNKNNDSLKIVVQ